MPNGPHLYFDDEDDREDEQVPRLPRLSNPVSKRYQRRNIQKQYAAARKGRTAEENTAKTAKKAGQSFRDKLVAFVQEHKKGLAIVVSAFLCIAILANTLSSCTVMASGGTEMVAISTYPSEDADMLGAEAAYSGMEADLQSYLDDYEDTHDYDEYHFDLDTIEHDPYVLISYLTAWFGGQPWTLAEAIPVMNSLFSQQYILTEEVTTETRYRTETETKTREVVDPDTGAVTTEEYEEEVEVPYDYYICNVSLENFNLSHLPVYTMSEAQMSFYAMYMQTLGNRPDLFPSSSYISIMSSYTYYGVPPEALEDEVFAKMLAEAEKYLGYPYVWGGSSPSTSFDCSGFVCWVINNCGVGWNVGRLGSDGLCFNVCTPVSPANARPGDLIFFQGTYDTPYTSHVGIYVGDGWMIHCGNPIQYANINSSYWQAHFHSFGRLPPP